MPRVIVTTDPTTLATDPAAQTHEVSVLLDEQVNAVHVSSRHAAAQLIERIAWAITDAEAAERACMSAERARATAVRSDHPAPRVHPSRPARRQRARTAATGARPR